MNRFFAAILPVIGLLIGLLAAPTAEAVSCLGTPSCNDCQKATCNFSTLKWECNPLADGTACNLDDQDPALKCDGEWQCRSGTCRATDLPPETDCDGKTPELCGALKCKDTDENRNGVFDCEETLQDQGTVCRGATDSCDLTEYCTGQSKFCPADKKQDRDNDGEPDCSDLCPDDPGKKVPGQCGCGKPETGDSDGDGTADCNDECPSDPAKTDPGTCGCGASDRDSDTDGWADCRDGCDFDRTKVTPGVCGCGVPETDTDNDGTADCNDGCDFDRTKTAPGVCGCGVSDVNTDGDSKVDCQESCDQDAGKLEPGQCGCGVSDRDGDGDGTPDCHDGCSSDPRKVAPGVCGCGVVDTDTDRDGTFDCRDQCPSDPSKTAAGVCGCGIPDTDSDADGTADCSDGCDADRTKTAPGVCGCGVADTDADRDGTLDCRDQCSSDPGKTAAGVCGCGTADTDTDSDGAPNCQDGCAADPGKLGPGQCGCGTPDSDGDGDGVANCNDGCASDAVKTAPGVCGCGVTDFINACGTCGALIVDDPSVLKPDPSLETGLLVKIDLDSQAGYLDLGDAGFDFPRPDPTTGAGGFTVAFWMKTEQKAGGLSIGLVGRDGNDAPGGIPESEWEINIPNDGGSRDKVRFRVFDNGGDDDPNNDQTLHLTGQSVTSDGQWHHVVARRNVLPGGARDVQSEFCLIIDGGADSDCRTRTFRSPLSNSGTVLVGALRSPSLSGVQETSLYQGALDDLRLYDRALSDDELAALIAKPGDRCDLNQDSCATSRLECDTSDPTTTTLTCPAEAGLCREKPTEEPEETGEPEPEPEATTPAEEPSVEPALGPVEPTSAPISDPAPLPLEPAPVLPVPVVAGDPVDALPEPIPASASSKALLPICFCVEDDLEAICGSEGEKIPLDGPCPRLSDQEVVEPEMTAFAIEVNRYMSDPRPNVLRESLMPRLAGNIDQWVDGETAHPIHVLRIQTEEATGQVGEIIDPAVKDRIREHFEIRKEGSLAPREDSPEPPILFSPGSVHYKNPEPILPPTPKPLPPPNPTGEPQDPSEPASDSERAEDGEREDEEGEAPRDKEKDREKAKGPHGRILDKEKAVTLTVNDQPEEYLLQPIGHAHVEGGGCSLIRGL